MKQTNVTTLYRLGLLLLSVFIISSCGKKATQDVPNGKVQQGTFYIDMYEEGEIEAVNSINIAAPSVSWRYGNLKITQIVKDGSEVQKGDTLIIFDPSEVQKGIVEAEGGLEISLAELEKLKAQHQSDLEELEADYKVTEISHEISQIEFESAIHESDIKKQEIQLNLEQAKISLARAKEQIENKKKIQKEELKQKQINIEQNRSRLKEAQETLAKLFMVSPAPGIAIIGQNWNGNKFQIGDQCWSGYPLIQLPDLSKLKATVKINEVDIAKIQKGLEVEIKPDAFSDSTFTGKVISVANLAVDKDNETKVKVFPVEVLINQTNKNLLPGLTVSCRLLIDKIGDVLFIPIDAINKENGKNYVYKKSGGGYNKHEVEVGLSNSDYIIITKGLDKGDEVALVKPFADEEETKGETAVKEEEV